ncbi:GlcG/HbpS family heme-binding protein [Paracraurococcus lichenis]|uniref:Heme-binding protein n=1 Tax=Paracraurococcus lichenis TaxID=3064888 RepID=A0ABT9E7G3_9PROT|nr:heme-binding protein [Paracraurococcus sp. LOR1-02]MDO9712120.1 heme-binding protein [Paracraurococcus sp. LOR1-02]
MRRFLAIASLLLLAAPVARADDGEDTACGIPAEVVAQIQGTLQAVVTQPNGGIFSPNRMWSAVVDRQGRLCSVTRIGDAWPGSRAIAMAKASTANDFSNDALALSTANLYSATQPGGSLYGLNNSNPFNPAFLVQGNPKLAQALANAFGRTPGGIITFGGGVPLYSGGKVIGGLGVSGDSACADHVIAYRMRRAVGLDAIPAGVGAGGTDNIDYLAAGEAPNGFKHVHCFPTDLPPDRI